MRTVRYLGPGLAIEFPGARLERDGDPVAISEAQYQQLLAQPERWHIELVTSGGTTRAPRARVPRGPARRPAGTRPRGRGTTSTSATSVTDTTQEG